VVDHNGDGGRCSSAFSSSSTEFVGMGFLGLRCDGAELQDLLVVPRYHRWEHLCRWKAKAMTYGRNIRMEDDDFLQLPRQTGNGAGIKR
jgi:hypothetical protein